MKTIAKLMALCLLLGTLAFAQATGGDKDKKVGDTKPAAADTGKKATKKATKKGAKKGAKKAAAADTKKAADDKAGKK